MEKCILCNKKIKFARKCPALNHVICSACCGRKKEVEIKCTDDCKYFVEGKIKENKKQIMKLVKESFNVEEDDVMYKNARMLELIGPFEQFVFQNYYYDMDINDDFIADCYIKMYYNLDGKVSIYKFNKIEMKICNEFNRIAKETKMPIESQKLILLRLIKSVDHVTGGVLGNRMYFELLKNTFI